jgi:hypothetical protein
MFYKSRLYQLNSLRLGLIHEDNIYGKPTIFVAMGSQSQQIKKRVDYYNGLFHEGKKNIVAIPFDNYGTEPGDNHEIYTHYENILGIEFYVTEKLSCDHIFFRNFGTPTNDFTEYHFDNKNKFIGKNL